MDLKPGDYGVCIFIGHQPMPAACANCPFTCADRGEDFLAPGRLDAIKFAVSMGQAFPCHKTTMAKGIESEVDEDGYERPPSWHRSYRQCRGAIDYLKQLAKERGIEPNVIGVDPG